MGRTLKGKNLLLKTEILSFIITLLHSERPKLYGVLVFLSAIGSRVKVH